MNIAVFEGIPLYLQGFHDGNLTEEKAVVTYTPGKGFSVYTADDMKTFIKTFATACDLESFIQNKFGQNQREKAASSFPPGALVEGKTPQA